MLKLMIGLIGPCLLLALGGCVGDGSIIAGTADSVGFVAAGNQAEGAKLNLGFRGAKFAVVPVETTTGRALRMKDCNGGEKSFSVLARLAAKGSAGAGTTLGADIHQVLAVGPAAEVWARAESGLTDAEVKAQGLASSCSK